AGSASPSIAPSSTPRAPRRGQSGPTTTCRWPVSRCSAGSASPSIAPSSTPRAPRRGQSGPTTTCRWPV
ncbi:hypothetical protein CTI14_71985, partial [Methylobacterium radiotolerans]